MHDDWIFWSPAAHLNANGWLPLDPSRTHSKTRSVNKGTLPVMLAALMLTTSAVASADEPPAAADGAKVPATTDTGPVDLSDPNAPTTDDPPVEEIHYPERRCGFTLGLMPTALMGTATGYTNDALRIDREEFFTNTGFSGGGAGFGWVGIAVADWLVFGAGGNFGVLLNGDYSTEFFGGAFHIDAFPLFALGDAWQDVGLGVEVGLSIATTQETATERVVIDAGLGSRIAVGAFYEGIRAWKLSMGPYVAVDTIFSQSAVNPVAAIGWRTAFYGGP